MSNKHSLLTYYILKATATFLLILTNPAGLIEGVSYKANKAASRLLLETSALTYQKVLPCLKDSKFAGGRNVSSWEFPPDAENHYKELLEKTKVYRNITPHEGPGGFRGPWIETLFIDYFMGKPLTFFNGLIPLFVQWTDIHVHSFDDVKDPKIPDFKDMLHKVAEWTRPDVVYIAVSQDDQGLFAQLAAERPNILSLSAGGFGHIPIPLIKGELNYTAPPEKYTWDVGFFGNVRPRLSRSRMLEEMLRALNAQGLNTKYSQSADWETDIGKSKFNLSPRGFGRTSYRLAEVIQIGRVPVYLYDDHPWLPYEGTELAFSTYGLSGKMGHLGGLAKELKQLSNETFSAKLQKVKEVREHYTYAGLLRQIEKFLGDPLGPNGGHLRCTRVPDKDH